MAESHLRADGTPERAYLLAGEDEGLVSQQLVALVEELAAIEALPGAIEEYEAPSADDGVALGAVLDACRTPPFLADRRVIVVRETNLDAAGQKELLAYLADPLETTVLVFALLGKKATATLQKAFAAAGRVLAVAPASGARGRQQWFSEHLAGAPVRLDNQAVVALDRHLGGDLARLAPLLESLAAAYGEHAHVSVEELEPFLGSAGESTPWDLTDAIAEGDAGRALEVLGRQFGAGRHPMQLLASLHRHYGALLRLDGAEIHDEAAAASATGLAPYPARKALEQSGRLGHERVARAIGLIAGADLDLRGRVDWPDELVIEVLVARLAQLSRLGRPAPRGRPARTGRR
ncbi:MAG TPA: DNA polymerase III subunit delta [Acidimicrobiales bacterium]|nr:DNA polymerase III subunit delta [Acidimicrobiales bacterium]